MSGNGNDFIVIDNRFYNFSAEELADLARRFCPRRTGIGADGILAYMLPDDAAHQYRMKYFNADGSLGTMCGNGARCLARFARKSGVVEETMQFESDAGVYRATAGPDDDNPVRIYVQPPQALALEKLSHPELHQPAHYIWTGTEHLVSFTESLDAVPVVALGRVLRNDATLAPNGANVNFVAVEESGAHDAPAQLRVRTYEKGVEDETLACGTGAMASAVIAKKTGLIASTTVQVHMAGGILGVGFDETADAVENLYLEGVVETIYRGTTEV
ncbi:MAG: diaminopimelate epimerase [Bacteroidota bacterium]